jgi:hypothetical protein
MADQSFPTPCADNLEIGSGHEDYFVVRGGGEAEGAVPQVAASKYFDSGCFYRRTVEGSLPL